MNKPFVFFCVATIITLLSVIVLHTGPVVNRKIGDDYEPEWRILNCLMKSDSYKKAKKDWEKEIDEDQKAEKDKYMKIIKRKRDSCYRKKAMYGLEYSAFTLDVVVGFTCSLLGLLHYLNEGKAFAPKSGLIGLVSGAIAFIITFVYLIYSILVFSMDTNGTIKTDESNAFAKWDDSDKVYMCLFFKEDNENFMYAKFSELGKKQYNYVKDSYLKFYHDADSDIQKCKVSEETVIDDCKHRNNLTISKKNDCDKLYIQPKDNNNNADLNNRWLTTIILSVIIILCDIFLALFGFLMFKNKEESGEVPVV